MAILVGDIKLVASQVMDDVPEGGGSPTANTITDGISNAIFNDISELDRAGGRVSLRKVFANVQTLNTDGYFGGNVIVADPPQDPLVSVTLFSTESVFDRRADATSRIEAYLNAGPSLAGFLYENHIAGQRTIQIFARTNVVPPPPGRTLLLRMNEGLGTQFEQYVRVTRVTSETRAFTYGADQDYDAQIITCDISDALRYDFPGSAANRQFAIATGKTVIRDTVVADAAVYHGVASLAQPVAIGEATAQVESVYTQLVPNAQTETSLMDQRPSAATEVVIATTPREVAVGSAPFAQRIRVGQENRAFNYTTILSPLPAPGSVRVTFRALGQNYLITDDGAGNLSGSGSGTVNYTTGSIVVTLQALPDDRSAVVFYWGQKSSYTNRAGTAGFRAPEYSFDLDHAGVIPGSFTITWTSGALVKTATDNGSGKLTGDAMGEIIYTTGMVFIRPAAMIDPGGEFSITYDWSTVLVEAKAGLVPDAAGVVAFTFDQEPVPGSIEIQWMTLRETSQTSGSTSASGSTSKSSDSGNAVSWVDTTKTYYDRASAVAQAFQAPVEEVRMEYIRPPDLGMQIGQWAITTKEPVVTTHQASSSDSSSYSSSASNTSKSSVGVSHIVTDDGAGNLFGTFGTVSYVAKTCNLRVTSDYFESSYASNYENAGAWESLNGTGEPTGTAGGTPGVTTTTGGGGSNTSRGGSHGSSMFKETFGGNSLTVRYKTGLATPQAATQTFAPPFVTIDLCPTTKDVIVPGSVRFTWMGHLYQDTEGKLYIDPAGDSPGAHVGTVNYTSGVAMMADYVVNGSPTNFTLNSLWTRKAREHIANVTFATTLAPIKPTGLTLSVLDTSGTQIIATANVAGEIAGPHTRGTIDYETGLVEVQFGDYVLDASLTAEQKAQWWYDANDVRVADTKIWRPWPIDPETLRYNAVAYFYLPLDADILGVDPVRLPQDGRVPIFRPGGFAVLGNTGTVGPATVSNGQTLNCARVRLSRVRVIGADGAVIDTGYTADLEAGTVTFTDVAGYAQPVTLEHRVEDLVQVAEVQIDGHLRFTRAATHAYSAPGSYLSSALIMGDLRARVSTTFDQSTWNNAWSDNQIGSAATGTFNDVLAPIAVTNKGAITERWIVRFTSTTAFEVIGEHVGVIAIGNVGVDCAPSNPATGVPYFTILAVGWGLGWSVGSVLRFNTVGALFPVWTVRTVQQGPESVPDDSFTLLIRGDVDRP